MAISALEIPDNSQNIKTVVEAADAGRASTQLLPQFPPCTPPPGLMRLPIHERAYVPERDLDVVVEHQNTFFPPLDVALETDDESPEVSPHSPEQKRSCPRRASAPVISVPDSQEIPNTTHAPPFSRSLMEALDLCRSKGPSAMQTPSAACDNISPLPPGLEIPGPDVPETVGKRSKKTKQRSRGKSEKSGDAPIEDVTFPMLQEPCVEEDEPLQFKFPCPVALEGVKSLKKDILKVDNTSFCYPSRNNDTLKDISFKLSQSSRVLIIGKSTSGKTTLNKLLLGQEHPSRGAIMMAAGLRVSCISAEKMQEIESSSKCTPEQFVRQSFEKSSDAQARDLSSQNIHSFLENFGLCTEHVNTPIFDLSSRMKLRLCVAVALWRSPNILILDDLAQFLSASDVNVLMPAFASYRGGILATCHSNYRDLMEVGMSQVWSLRGSCLHVQGEGVLDSSAPQESREKIVARMMMKQLEERVKDPSVTAEEKIRLLAQAKELLQRL